MSKSSGRGYKTRARRSSVRFVGEVVDADAPPVSKKRKPEEPVRRSVLATGDTDSEPLPDPTLGLRALYASSIRGSVFVWWSCTVCKRTRYGTHWWALYHGCDHEGGWHEATNNNPKGFSNESIFGTFASWCERMGVIIPDGEMKAIVLEEKNPWD